MKTYSIIRFRVPGRMEILRTGVTLAEATEHCSRWESHGSDWYDGYREDPVLYVSPEDLRKQD